MLIAFMLFFTILRGMCNSTLHLYASSAMIMRKLCNNLANATTLTNREKETYSTAQTLSSV